MKAAFLDRPGLLTVRQTPDPTADGGSVVVRVRVCTVCASDLRMFRQGHPRVQLPQILGHEISGVVESVGRNVEGYAEGDRVAIVPKIPCGECVQCQKGEYTRCPKGMSFGYQLPGGFAELLAIPARGVERAVLNWIGDTVGFEEASLAESLACCIRAQRMINVSPGNVVVIIGGGPLGILHCRLARARRAGMILLVHRDRARLDLIEDTGANVLVDSTSADPQDQLLRATGGQGADVVIVACSSKEAQTLAIKMIGRGGRVNFFGGLARNDSHILVDSNVIHYDEVLLMGSHGSTVEDNIEALRVMRSREVLVADLVTHHYPLDSIGAAFDAAASKAGMKVAVHPQAG